MATTERLTAFFIDFENVYYYLRNALPNREDANDVAVEVVQRLRAHVLEKYGEAAVSLDAYGDFEQIEDNSQGSLYLLGVETHNVLGTDHKNAADMKLCIDVMDTLYTRPEIQSFIVVAGDRDYIPIIRHVKKHGRTVRVASFRANVSGDLLTIVGEQYFIDASEFIDRAKFAPRRQAAAAEPTPTPAPLHQEGPAASPTGPAKFAGGELAPAQMLSAYESALGVMLTHFGDKREVWVTPYLNKLRQEMPQLAESERKTLIQYMADQGVVKVEKRKGEPYDYSVLVINWNHSDVQKNNR